MQFEEQAIDIIAFLVTQYRKAINHNGEPEPIEKTRAVYCESIKEMADLTDNELHIIYLKGKIKADEEQLERHQEELAELNDIKFGDELMLKKNNKKNNK